MNIEISWRKLVIQYHLIFSSASVDAKRRKTLPAPPSMQSLDIGDGKLRLLCLILIIYSRLHINGCDLNCYSNMGKDLKMYPCSDLSSNVGKDVKMYPCSDLRSNVGNDVKMYPCSSDLSSNVGKDVKMYPCSDLNSNVGKDVIMYRYTLKYTLLIHVDSKHYFW
jgi:hypothetical protein